MSNLLINGKAFKVENYLCQTKAVESSMKLITETYRKVSRFCDRNGLNRSCVILKPALPNIDS